MCEDIEYFKEKVKLLFKENPTLSMCPFYDIEKEYRLFYLDGEILLVYGKNKPFIIGNGKDSARTIIENEGVDIKIIEDNKDNIINDIDDNEYWKRVYTEIAFVKRTEASYNSISDLVVPETLGTNANKLVVLINGDVDYVNTSEWYHLTEFTPQEAIFTKIRHIGNAIEVDTIKYVNDDGETVDSYSTTVQEKNISQTISNSVNEYPSCNAVKEALAQKQNTLNSAQLNAVNSGVNSTKVAQIGTNTNDIAAINGKLSSDITSSNKAVSQDYVDNAINSLTAYYITKNAQGDPFSPKAELTNASVYYSGGEIRVPTRNDYCYVLDDETHDHSTTRYSYQNNQWEFQIIVNETPLTISQLAALNSGITDAKVAQIQTNTNTINIEYCTDLFKQKTIERFLICCRGL